MLVTPAVPADLKGAWSAVARLNFDFFCLTGGICGVQ